jgi:AcrR family transcriptional regulator
MILVLHKNSLGWKALRLLQLKVAFREYLSPKPIATISCNKSLGGLIYSPSHKRNLHFMASTKAPKKPPLVQPRGDEFVQIVLETTLLHLAEVGFERLSIPQIAQITGVNKTSIYRRWPTKIELVRDTFSVAMQHAEHVPDTGALRSDLIELAQGLATFMQSPLGTAILRIMMAEGSNPELRALAQNTYQKGRKQGPFLVLQRAIARGELKTEVDPSMVLFTVAGAIIHRVFVEHGVADNAYLSKVVDLILLGAIK